jgi:hypothetical protein
VLLSCVPFCWLLCFVVFWLVNAPRSTCFFLFVFSLIGVRQECRLPRRSAMMPLALLLGLFEVETEAKSRFLAEVTRAGAGMSTEFCFPLLKQLSLDHSPSCWSAFEESVLLLPAPTRAAPGSAVPAIAAVIPAAICCHWCCEGHRFAFACCGNCVGTTYRVICSSQVSHLASGGA